MFRQDAISNPVVEGLVGPPSAHNPKYMITRNAFMRHFLKQLDHMAATQATVLIQGESGTGKEVLAHAIHYSSRRREGPFVRLNCASLPEGMLESELFGHERGAFTGAVRQRPGRFELAHEGTLFLDEIGAADTKVQLRLLRVLQEREFERVGGTQTLSVDVRIVAATNADLKKEVGKGGFREDLFYRLNVVPVRLPALRERSEDIPLLIDHFLKLYARRNNCAPVKIAPEAVKRLQSYPWPGNIRELENIVERMAIFTRRDILRVEDVPQEILQWQEEEELAELSTSSFQAARALFERRYLCNALRRYNGVISQVARAIGMSRKNLYMRLEDLHIDYKRFRV